jgi:hypothetical protein
MHHMLALMRKVIGEGGEKRVAAKIKNKSK